MKSNPAPLPQPMRNTCPNCGFGWNESTLFCPRCGASLSSPAQQKFQPATQLALGCALIVLGGMGACFSMLGFSSGFNADALNPFSFIGVALVATALFLLWKLVRRGR